MLNQKSNISGNLFNKLKILALIFLFTFNSINSTLFAQENERSHKSRHGKLDSTAIIYTSEDQLKKIAAYGSLRAYMGVSYDGYFGIDGGSSRLGVAGKTFVTKDINAFAVLELGVNGVDNNPDLIFHADPNATVTEINNTITARLGILGFETKLGNISFGKQWSPYYDVGGFSDLSLAFGGEAQGTYPCGTDGGVAGTGRAANSLQFRTNIKFVKIGLQVQFRDLGKQNIKFADTYAASLIYANPAGISFGLAYNKVLDGVENPYTSQSKKGDEAAIAGLYIQKKQFTIGGTFSILKNHEKDDMHHYFNGNGYEFFIIYEFLKHWSALSGINYLKPYGNAHGEYEIKYLMLGVSYYFTKTSLVFLETKLEDSKYVNGDKRKSIIGFGVHYDF